MLCLRFPFFKKKKKNLLRPPFHVGHGTISGSRALCTGPTTYLTSKYFTGMCHTSGSRALFTGPTNLFFSYFFIKNRSHGTIYTFKNYFATVFSIFSKINSIQTDSYFPKLYHLLLLPS